MRLVMTLLVRDEVDVVRANVDFHLEHGVDFIIATDNGSVDGTREVLADLENTGQVRVIDEHGDDFSQGRWVTRMAFLARDEHGADWVLNNDADEFWLPSSGDLKSGLAKTEAAVLHCPRRNMMFPHNRRGADTWYEELVYRVTDPDPRPVLEDSLRDPLPVPYLYLDLPPKALCRSRGLREIFDGNHNARHDNGTRELWSSVQIYHYPVRSFDQFERKIRSGGAAFERNTSLPKRTGWHWRRWYRMLLEGDAEAAFGEILPSEQRLLDDLHAGRVVVDRTMTGKIA